MRGFIDVHEHCTVSLILQYKEADTEGFIRLPTNLPERVVECSIGLHRYRGMRKYCLHGNLFLYTLNPIKPIFQCAYQPILQCKI